MPVTKDVLSINPESKGDKTWTSITVRDKNGKEKKEHIFDLALVGVFKAGGVPGQYEMGYKKEGQFWNLSTAKKVGGATAPAPSQPAAASGSQPAPAAAAPAATTSTAEIRARVGGECVRAAAEVVAAMVAQGFFRDDPPATVEDAASAFGRRLMDEVRDYVRGVSKKGNGDGPGSAPVGA